MSLRLFDNKNLLLVIFILLLTLATLITRTVNNETNMRWFDDSARDTSVAQLITENGEYTDIRPAAGFLPALKNATLYYNYLAGLYWLSGKNSARFFDLYAAISGITTVISIFLIGYILYGFRLAVPAGITVLIHPLLILINVSIYCRDLLASLTPLFVLCVLLAYKNKTLITLWLATISYLLLLCAHYGALTLLPVFLWIHYDFFRSQPKRKYVLLNLVFLLISLGAFLNSADIDLNELQAAQAQETGTFLLIYPIYQVFLFFQTLINWELKYPTVLLAVLIFFLILVKKKTDLEKHFFWIIATYFLVQVGTGYVMGLFGMGSTNLESDYFYHYLALFTLIPYLALLHLTPDRQYKKVFDFLLVLLFLGYTAFLSLYPQPLTEMEQRKTFYRTKSVAAAILNHHQQSTLNNQLPIIIDNTSWETPPGWFAPSIVYHLTENISDYYRLRKNGNNLAYKRTEFDSFYLVCRRWRNDVKDSFYSGDPAIIKQRCVDDLFTNHVTGITRDNLKIDTTYIEEDHDGDKFVVLFIETGGQTLSSDFLLSPWPDPPSEKTTPSSI